ncbi:MAG: DUF294 nucleotidyltransferase-like domain-containing protein, partial [Acidimicrobiia bacterium]
MADTSLRAARAALLEDDALRGSAFGAALSARLDAALAGVFDAARGPLRVSLVALGSYARRELCPGSDVDLLLLHDVRTKQRDAAREVAERCWYPLWDAGFVTGHALRSVKESIALADAELDTMTSFLVVRPVAGDDTLTTELVAKARQLAVRRSARVLAQLADAADLRRVRPGLVSEMLEPDLKEGGGGLRDLHALEWVAYALGADGIDGLAARGFVSASDAPRLELARDRLLDIRVALHRVTGGRTDRLALQEQPAVAGLLGLGDADALMHDLSSVGREVAWITRDASLRIRDHVRGPSGRVARRDRVLAEGVVLREGRVVVTHEPPVPALLV